jgi:ADP-ribose pyrophosphatase YjhB (NUDIX family)
MKKAVLLIVEKNGKILFARRHKDRSSLPDKWSLPSETMKENQSVEETAKHCALSELGIKLSSIEVAEEYHFHKGDEQKTLYFVKVKSEDIPKINKETELTKLEWRSWKNFFTTYPFTEIGHGLQYLKKKYA